MSQARLLPLSQIIEATVPSKGLGADVIETKSSRLPPPLPTSKSAAVSKNVVKRSKWEMFLEDTPGRDTEDNDDESDVILGHGVGGWIPHSRPSPQPGLGSESASESGPTLGSSLGLVGHLELGKHIENEALARPTDLKTNGIFLHDHAPDIITTKESDALRHSSCHGGFSYLDQSFEIDTDLGF